MEKKKQLYTISQVYSEISVYSTTKHPYTEIFVYKLSVFSIVELFLCSCL